MRAIGTISKYLLVICAYYFACKIGMLAGVGPDLSAVWPQGAVAIAALVFFGYGYWPAVTIASLVTNSFLLHSPVGVYLLAPLGNTLAALIATYPVNRYAVRESPLVGLRKYFLFIFFAVLVSSLVRAVSASVVFYLFNDLHKPEILTYIGTAWLGHACTNLVVVPFFVSLILFDWSHLRKCHWLEGAIMTSLLAFASGIIYFGWFQVWMGVAFPGEYFLLPFLLWSAFRLGPLGCSWAIALVSTFAIASNVMGLHSALNSSASGHLLLLQLYLAVNSLIIGILCAANSEREGLIARKNAQSAEVEEQKAILETVFSISPVGLALLDKDLRYVQINDVLAEMNGIPVEMHIGRKVEELLPGVAPFLIPKLKSILATGKPIDNLEASGRPRPNAAERAVRLNYYPVYKQGELSGIGCAVVDITEHKRIEAELSRRASDLEASNQELEQYAYVASHDLQEPLRMVSIYVQKLQEKYRDQMDLQTQDWIKYIVGGSQRMSQLIRDLLEYSRSGRMMNPPTVTHGDLIVKEALTNLSASLKEAHANIEIGELPEVLGDRARLVSLFQNLLSNAIKYRSETAPQISIDSKKSGDEWVFTVADNGIGIEKQYLERVFQIFQRLHSVAEYSGTGIGLSICKKIVETHGGRIWLDSVPGKGTTVYFTLPRVKGESESRPADPPSPMLSFSSNRLL